MGTYEGAGEAHALTSAIREVLSRIDAHAARAGRAERGGAATGSPDPGGHRRPGADTGAATGSPVQGGTATASPAPGGAGEVAPARRQGARGGAAAFPQGAAGRTARGGAPTDDAGRSREDAARAAADTDEASNAPSGDASTGRATLDGKAEPTALGGGPAGASRAELEGEADRRKEAAHAAADTDELSSNASGDGPAAVAPAPAPATAALDALVACFGLSPFERDIVLLTAAAELEPTTGARCAAACGDPERAHPTFSLALAALREPHWSALTPVSPLRRWRIVELDDETRLTTSRLRLDERILHFLAGSPYLDARLHGMLRRAAVPDSLPASYDLAAERVAAGWAGAPLRVELVGGDMRTRADIAAAAARRRGLGLYEVAAEDIPTGAAERDRLARLWQREAILLPAALLVEVGDVDREQAAAVDAFVESAAVPLVVSGSEPRRTARARGERVLVPPLDADEQLGVWTDAFAGVPEVSEDDLRDLVAQFSLPPHLVRSAGAAVARDLPGEDELDATDLAWRAGLTEARMGMDELGRRIEPQADWGDLVLADRQLRVLREIVAHVRQRPTVYQEWGFADTLRRGLGVTALFAGGSGTGKTLAAEVMAKELGLDLFIIDLSQVVSKYIGETEKNLRRVFDAAERGGALLLFDEADALFGKRSEVKDSHDRYANLEVSYLLMRMEAYRGLAILTTNMKQALDTAFMRRIRFVVDFPFPGESERAEIWRRVLPARVPMKDVDPQLLARLTVAGGSIRNIALSGAFLAAEEGDRLQMRHMLEAARTEYLKLDRSLTPSEVHGWV
ncbi:AAA family ATPase [Streptomyces sp. V4I23]|uniref:AAA family ATPase n=1 Tax=Streptomyces sp. V4I23 TaxID=3042282 RepID=UPI0027D8F699|nr:AAA family ATPase [Streptomyces sp. V4I23]